MDEEHRDLARPEGARRVRTSSVIGGVEEIVRAHQRPEPVSRLAVEARHHRDPPIVSGLSVGENVRPHAVEVADFWLSLGLAIGLEHGREAQQLLGLIEANEEEMAELAHDARAFLEKALA